MIYSFTAYGHPNILSKHKDTLEITKENSLTKNGDCIIGINADFDLGRLKDFIKSAKGEFVEIELRVGKFIEKIKAQLNKNFNDESCIVIRKSNFISDRTLVFRADKSASDLDRRFVFGLLSNDKRIRVSIIGK